MGEPSFDFTSQPQMLLPSPSALTSSPVSTASTPGIASADGLVDAADAGVGVRAADEVGVGLAGLADVVGVAPLAGDEALVLLADDARADALRRPWRGYSAAWAVGALPPAAAMMALTMLW